MGAFFTAILAKITGLAAWLITLVLACFVGWWLLGTDLGAWLFEQVLDIVISVLNGMSWNSAVFNPGTYISALPEEVANMMALMRVGECVAILAAAVVVRLTLQLIPFTRLGS